MGKEAVLAGGNGLAHTALNQPRFVLLGGFLGRAGSLFFNFSVFE